MNLGEITIFMKGEPKVIFKEIVQGRRRVSGESDTRYTITMIK